MRTSREVIYGALFSRLSAISLLKLASRKLRHYDEVAEADSPALFMTERAESLTREPHTPTRREYRVDVWVVVKRDTESDEVPTTELNAVLDAVESALEPDKLTHRQTLGGAVYHCRIDGEIEKDEGLLGHTTAVAIVPIAILVP
jgi:hypothetical protein